MRREHVRTQLRVGVAIERLVVLEHPVPPSNVMQQLA
jgi:hypothetical protein